MHLNFLWIELKFILLPLNLFLSSDLCVGGDTELVLHWQIPLRHFEVLELLLVYTPEGVTPGTMYIMKAGGRARLSNFKLCNIRMKTYLNKCFPFVKSLVKALGHMFRLSFLSQDSFNENFLHSCLIWSFMELNHDCLKAP